jgi:hypothetical protein
VVEQLNTQGRADLIWAAIKCTVTDHRNRASTGFVPPHDTHCRHPARARTLQRALVHVTDQAR